MNVITLGTFDLTHHGHIRLFKKCRQIAGDGHFVIGLNSDEFIKKYKGKLPVMSYKEREQAIEELEIADLILKNDQPKGNAKDIILQSMADLIVVGSDWARKDYYLQMGFNQDWLDERGIGLIYVPYTDGISTTDLRKRVLSIENNSIRIF